MAQSTPNRLRPAALQGPPTSHGSTYIEINISLLPVVTPETPRLPGGAFSVGEGSGALRNMLDREEKESRSRAGRPRLGMGRSTDGLSAADIGTEPVSRPIR